MFILAKLAAVAIGVWFFISAKQKGESPINWAIIGLIGYWLTWLLVKYTVVAPLVGTVPKNSTGTFFILQLPAICAIVAAYFIRIRLIASAEEKNE